MIIPPSIRSGDKVGIVATAKRVDEELLKTGVKILSQWGLVPILGDHVFDQHRFFAGTDQDRLQDLQHMLNDSEIKAIFCARGGYGTSRIIDKVDFSSLRDHPKWIIGFSDITILHLHLNKIGIASLHAPMPATFHKTSPDSLSQTKQFLFEGSINKLRSSNAAKNKKGISEGELIGGNLSLIAHSLLTPSSINTEGKILIIEEVDEPLYKLDRLFLQLKRSNFLMNLKGLVIGQLTNVEEDSYNSNPMTVIAEYLNEYSYPVGFGFEFGHDFLNFPVPLGMNYRFVVSDEGAELELL